MVQAELQAESLQGTQEVTETTDGTETTKAQAAEKKKQLERATETGWITTEDGNKLFLDGDTLKTSPSGKAVQTKGQGKTSKKSAFESAREQNKKQLDKFRKEIESKNEKAREKYTQKFGEHYEAKEKLDQQWSKVNELSEQSQLLSDQQQRNPTDTAIWDQIEKNDKELTQARIELEPLEAAEARARNEKNKAREELRSATSRAFQKESASVDKEDGISESRRKDAANRVKEHNTQGQSFVGSGEASELFAGVQHVAENRSEAQTYLRDTINNTIHENALTAPIKYESGIRASAEGGVVQLENGVEVAFVGTVNLDVDNKPHVIIHEFGHEIEHGNKEVRQLAEDFLAKRVGTVQSESLAERFPVFAYTPDERGSPDDFAKAHEAVGHSKDESLRLAYYVGKDYTGTYGQTQYKTPTEIISMGMELMHKDAVAFAKADPEWFDLVAGVATGRLLTETRTNRRESK
jgi:hypothetical protein